MDYDNAILIYVIIEWLGYFIWTFALMLKCSYNKYSGDIRVHSVEMCPEVLGYFSFLDLSKEQRYILLDSHHTIYV